MEHFKVFSLKAQLLCLILIVSQPSINGSTIQGSLPDMPTVMEMVQMFINPFLKSIHNIKEPNYRTGKETLVEKVIRKKVAELKHLLQDDDVELSKDDKENENLTLEGKDETTILEIVTREKKHNNNQLRNLKRFKANNLLKNRVDEYKELRHKIKAALKKEHVSKSTQILVTSALDGMMTQLIKNQCNWRSLYNKENNTLIANKTVWNKQWNNLKKDLLKPDPNRNTSIPAELFLFFEKFHEFLNLVGKDFKLFRDHRISCKFTKRNSTDANKYNFRQGKTTKKVKQYKCAYFKICSEELSNFMTSFYYTLNDTSISTLKNYASMYVRDTDDSEEKERVVGAVNNITDLAEPRITKIFIKATVNFRLSDKKDKNTNIQALRDYIKDTIEKTKTVIKIIIESSLKSLTLKLMQSVKKDLSVNLDVDLNNLERDFKSRICTVFSICNGQYAGRRGGEELNFQNRNSVYVKVQLSLDDELKDTLGRSNSAVLYDKPRVFEKDKKKKIHHKKSSYKGTKMYRKSFENNGDMFTNFNITRTTLINYTTTEISPTTIIENEKTSSKTVAAKKETSLNTTIQ